MSERSADGCPRGSVTEYRSAVVRNLVIVFGDQLSHCSSAFTGFDPDQDAVWMAETSEENTHVWCHKQRIVLFLSAMRHFRDELRDKGYIVHYTELTLSAETDRGRSFEDLLRIDLPKLRPKNVIFVRPGDLRVENSVQSVLTELLITADIRVDTHFLITHDEFATWAKGKKSLVLEFFYRWVRKTKTIFLDEQGQPEGGQWNFDSDNRQAFGKAGPPPSKALTIQPDELTRQVMALTAERFANHPGLLDSFDWPVNRAQSLSLLQHFVTHQLPEYGRWQDAMWTGEAFLFHSRLSSSLNMKLLSPQECVDAATQAWQNHTAPINSVEGFIRQIVGWREFVRGIYYLTMPDYAAKNHFSADRQLPSFFWDGNTDMNCVKSAMQNVLKHGWTHHIERLMVLGNFAQLWGTNPYLFHEWHMAMYVDAIDWVSLPNTLGMSQYGDGGLLSTKPYCASGNYIHKMSNFCEGCRYDYRKRTGENACPFTTLYWHFLDRHADHLQNNSRMTFAMANLKRIRSDADELTAIHERAEVVFNKFQKTSVKDPADL